MNRAAITLTLIAWAGMLAFGQNTKIVFDENFVDDNANFDGQYLVYADMDAPTMTADHKGRISGKLVTYYESGKVESVGSIFKDEKHGPWTAWNEEGMRINEGEYMYGAKDGLWRVWDDNGTLRYEMHYRNGKRVHTWKIYDESGALIEQKTY